MSSGFPYLLVLMVLGADELMLSELLSGSTCVTLTRRSRLNLGRKKSYSWDLTLEGVAQERIRFTRCV